MRVNGLRNTFSREGFFTESSLDVIQYLRVRRIGLVQDVAQCKVRGPQSITEVLSEDPATVYGIISPLPRQLMHNPATHRHK